MPPLPVVCHPWLRLDRPGRPAADPAHVDLPQDRITIVTAEHAAGGARPNRHRFIQQRDAGQSRALLTPLLAPATSC
jgi:hypothetical protein